MPHRNVAVSFESGAARSTLLLCVFVELPHEVTRLFLVFPAQLPLSKCAKDASVAAVVSNCQVCGQREVYANPYLSLSILVQPTLPEMKLTQTGCTEVEATINIPTATQAYGLGEKDRTPM